jgi:hypothetical protein
MTVSVLTSTLAIVPRAEQATLKYGSIGNGGMTSMPPEPRVNPESGWRLCAISEAECVLSSVQSPPFASGDKQKAFINNAAPAGRVQPGRVPALFS